MTDDRIGPDAELAKIEQAIVVQEGLRGILPDEQVEALLASLQEKRQALLAALAGSGAAVKHSSVTAGAGGVAVGRDVYGDVIVVADPDLLWQAIRRRAEQLPSSGDETDVAALHALLRDAFTAKELWRFCRDRPAFRPVLADLAHDYSLEDLIDRLLEYCRGRDLIPELLAEVQQANPRQYERYAALRPFPSRVSSPARGPSDAAPDLSQATERYLAHLVDRYRYMEFKGMGVSDRVPLRLPLVELYVPLKARIELPEGETWARGLRLAGRPVSAGEAEATGQYLSEPMPALDLLRQHDGLIVLGDPGAGKTTFLKYLALRLAQGEGETLGLGVRLPVLLPLSAYANALAARDVPLDRFVAEYYHDRGVDLAIGPLLSAALAQGGMLLLLDGLDEVRDLGQRHLVVQRVLDFVAFHRRQGNKFILTSRIVGYREVRPTVEGLAECTLVDFDDDEIAEFVSKWTGALERAARGDTPVAAQEAAREGEELLAAVRRNPGVRRLAANPLLLTILAVMKRQGVMLPERRVELYQKYIETLLRHWNLARGLGRPPGRDLDVIETVRVLAPLALWMHETSPGVGLVRREAMRCKLEEIYAGRGSAEPEQAARQLLVDAREYAGLLLERGAGEYGFIHLTFQEYLAAVAIALQGQREIEPVVDALAAHIGDDNWHEVSLLTIGYLGIVQQRDEAAGAALWELIQRAPGEPGQAAVLAGEAVFDAWPGGVTPGCRERVIQTLLATMRSDGQVKPAQRAAAGRSLAKLGDPRPEATAVEGMQFCCVPPGPFWMGEGKEAHRNERLDYGYWVGRYPVTNAQFRAFVEAGGYRDSQYWPEARKVGVWNEGQVKALNNDQPRGQPYEFRDPFNLPNHPVVSVTWHEALAFARWLADRLRRDGLLPEGWEVRLPSEAEWEKAARGGAEAPAEPVVEPAGALAEPKQAALALRANPRARGGYPWGDEADPNRANYDDTGIGATSAVGCFPGGASPYGAEELSGNVWEWTRSNYSDYSYDPEDGREELNNNAHRMLRGGAFYGSQSLVRCAYRVRFDSPDRDFLVGFRVVVVPV